MRFGLQNRKIGQFRVKVLVADFTEAIRMKYEHGYICDELLAFLILYSVCFALLLDLNRQFVIPRATYIPNHYRDLENSS